MKNSIACLVLCAGLVVGLGCAEVGEIGPPVLNTGGAGGATELGGTGGDNTHHFTGTLLPVNLCGNGVLDPGELCDGDCPKDCLLEPKCGDHCTKYVLEGSAETCDAECVLQVITECIDDDDCCPEGCKHDEDNDCHW